RSAREGGLRQRPLPKKPGGPGRPDRDQRRRQRVHIQDDVAQGRGMTRPAAPRGPALGGSMQMRRYTPAALLFGAAFVFALAVSGCGPGGGEGDDDYEPTGHGKGPKKPKAALTAIEPGKNTTLKGRVVIKGSQPNIAALTSDLEDQIRKKNL